MSRLLPSVLAYSFRPVSVLRELRGGGALLRFSAVLALLVSAMAGVRAALIAGEPGQGAFRFATSFFGFLLLPAILAFAGGLLGGKGRVPPVAAAVIGCSVPFLLVDALWVGALGFLGPEAVDLTALRWLEHAIQGWSAVVLVLGLAEAHSFSRWRAVGTLGLVAAVAIGAFLGARALGS